MRARLFFASWQVLTAAGLLAAIPVTGCSLSQASSSGAAGNASSPPGTLSRSTAPAGQSGVPTPSASPSPTESAGIQDLLVSSAVRGQLTAAFEALTQIPASDVSGTYPGSVYYAYDPATNTYWALAKFVPSKTDPLNVSVEFQDGGGTGFFTKTGSSPWKAQIGHDGPCVDILFFPKAVLAAWAFPTTPPAGMSC